MNVLYFVPHLSTIYAGRTIYYGYKNAFEKLGHTFKFLTADDNHAQVFKDFEPDIVFLGLNPYVLKFIDLEFLKNYKKNKKQLKICVTIPYWKSPFSKSRINESPGLLAMKNYHKIIANKDFIDVPFCVFEHDDERMEGYQKALNRDYLTLPLAVDITNLSGQLKDEFKADISFIGTNLPEKKAFFRKNVFPLMKNYSVKLYGQDWTFIDRLLGFGQKLGMYFNIPVIKDIQKPKLKLTDEPDIYASSIISINVHELYQKHYGGDCNERTFKIPGSGGFEVTDNVACIKKYFKENEEIIIGETEQDWLEKVLYYLKNPEKRKQIIEKGRTRVLKDHTYIQRVNKVLEYKE